MKKVTLLATLLALALGASAETVNFASLPTVTHPTVIPNGFADLNWSGFSYVDPIWAQAGIGFRLGPNALDVAYMGGGFCELTEVSCSASISAETSMTHAVGEGFLAHSAIVAAGYHAETINVVAYNQGVFVGSKVYNLNTSLQQIDFPACWGVITQLVIDTTKGTVVLYALKLDFANDAAYDASANAGNDAQSTAPKAGPTAPKRIGPTAPKDVSATAGDDAQSNAPKAGPTAPKVGATAPKNIGPTAPKNGANLPGASD